MLDLRARLEAVVMNYHAIEPVDRHPAFEHLPGHECHQCKKKKSLVDDLVACLPQPSREALITVLEEFQGFTHCQFGRHKGICEKCAHLMERLLTWATTSAEATPVWCQDIVYVHDAWRLYWPGTSPLVIPVRWKTCPVCAAPRPPEA